MRVKIASILAVIGVTFSSIGWQEAPKQSYEGLMYEVNQDTWVDSVANSLTLEQKIGQFFMAATYTNKDLSHKNKITSLIDRYNIGGVIFFQGDPVTQVEWYNEFQSRAQTPLYSSIDGEWGINMRLSNTIKYPRQLTLGAIEDEKWIYDFGTRVAQECKATGININLAPVIDINNNPDNPVINDRSFGEDKYNVAIKGLSYIQGMQDAGVMAVGKHFPGHGDTNADSHHTLPVINHNYSRLDSLELYPFKVAFKNNLMGVMAAHLHIPSLDDSKNLAVSLSPKVTTSLLRDTLGFQGLVFSDALNMKGVSDYYEPGEVDKVAFLAGNDILLFSENIPRGISLILKAVENGEISEEYINERLEKVLSYKYKLNLQNWDSLSTTNLVSYLNNNEGKNLQKNLFEKAITVVNNDDKIIPLNFKEKNIASLSIGADSKNAFQNLLTPFGKIDHYTAGKTLTISQANYISSKLSSYDEVIINVTDMSRYSSKKYGFSTSEINLIHSLQEKTKVLLVLFGSPYSLSLFENFDNIVVAYENNTITQQAAANLLIGAIGANGTIPVSAGNFKAGTGLTIYPTTDMGYTIPEDKTYNTDELTRIDFIAKNAIANKATPGCQIVVAKDGKIFYNKTFGKPTYTSTNYVKKTDLYDLASITKMSATTLSIMKLYEDGFINLDDVFSSHLPQYKGTEVGTLSIREVLAHQSGLPAWIPFYTRSIKEEKNKSWYSSSKSTQYSIKVAKEMYMNIDSVEVIWDLISKIELKSKKYKYSDLGMYILKQLIEKKTNQAMESYVENTFYYPLGLTRTTFNPLEKFNLGEIIPSENDDYFRNQNIQGYVHDMGAAMLGGVGGHAGLFSTAFEQAVIMQMLLNNGIYNGDTIIKKNTIELFTTRAYTDNENRRGLGFDKPVMNREGGPTTEEVSDASFGHTGFTGTFAWADPDYNLVFVFLSNRTYPSMENKKLITMNVRTDIQKAIYNSIGIYSDIE